MYAFHLQYVFAIKCRVTVEHIAETQCGSGGRGSKANMQALGKLRGVLLDLSGTVHVEDTPTPGALRALSR